MPQAEIQPKLQSPQPPESALQALNEWYAVLLGFSEELSEEVVQMEREKAPSIPNYTVEGLPFLGDSLVKARAHSDRASTLLSKCLRKKGRTDKVVRLAKGLYQGEYDQISVRVAASRPEFSWEERASDCRLRVMDATIALRRIEAEADIIYALVEAAKVLERTASRGRGDLQAVVDVVKTEQYLARSA